MTGFLQKHKNIKLDSWVDATLLCLVIFPTTWFRLRTSDFILFGIDECFHMLFALKPTVKEMFAMLYRVAPQQFPLDYLFNFAMVRCTENIYTLRWLPLFWGACSIGICYFLGRHLWNRTFGWLWSWMLATSVLHTAYSHQLRPYSLIVFLSLLSLFTFFKSLKNKKWIPTHAISLFLFQAAYPFAVAFSLMFVITAFMERPKTKQALILCSAASWILPLAWLLKAGTGLLSNPVFYYEPSTNNFGNFLFKVVIPFRQGLPRSATVMAGLFFIGVIGALFFKQSRTKAVFFIFLYTFTGLFVWVSMRRANLFIESRHLIVLLPIFLGFAAFPLAWVSRNSIIAAMISFLLAMMALPAFQGYLNQQCEASNVLKDGSIFFSNIKGPNDKIIFSNPNLAATFLYYHDRLAFNSLHDVTLNKGFNLVQLPPEVYSVCSLDPSMATIDKDSFEKLEKETKHRGGNIWFVYHSINYFSEPQPFTKYLGIDPKRIVPVHEGIYLLR